MTGCPVGAYEEEQRPHRYREAPRRPMLRLPVLHAHVPLRRAGNTTMRGASFVEVRHVQTTAWRATAGRPPAVQACPNEAISIRIVSQAAMIQAAEAGAFLPGAPDPDQTLPTTVYKRKKRCRPTCWLTSTSRPENSHFALVIMLTLTQLAVGSFGFGVIIEHLRGRAAGSTLAQTTFACVVAVIALLASVFHLGRPWLFWRAILGLRTSWLSREALLRRLVFLQARTSLLSARGWGS